MRGRPTALQFALRLWRKTSLTLLKQNRMTSELSNFAARLRERILLEGRVTRGPDLEAPNQDWDSGSSPFRDDDVFNSLALDLFTGQFAHNAAYRKISEARGGTPITVTHWSQIPAVPTTAFKELELTCLAPRQRTHVFHSSGTTEQRSSRHFHNAESLAIYEASLLTWFRACIPSTANLLILTPTSAQAPHSSLVHMFETVRRDVGAVEISFVGHTQGDGSWRLDFGAASQALNCACRDNKPLTVLGTAFSFVHLVDFLAEHDLSFQLPPGSCVMETGGYKGRSRSLPKAKLHSLIKTRLGIPVSHIIPEYGTSELSSQAYDGGARDSEDCSHPTPDSQHFHFPPWARVQIISPETGREVAEGETGLIRVFDLANVFSVMAIQTEDLGIRRGVGFELIGRAELAEPRGCSLMAV